MKTAICLLPLCALVVLSLACGGIGIKPPVTLPVAGSEEGEMTWNDFMARRPKQPTTMRVSIQVANQWDFAFRNTQATYYSFHIGGGGFPNELAWAKKDSAEGKKLHGLCDDGVIHDVTIKVAFAGPDGKPTAPDDRSIVISGVVSDH